MLMADEMLAKVSSAAKFLHAAWQPVIDHISELNMERHNNLDCVRRSALKRQHDCLKAALTLTDVELGETTVPFLRPAIEEVIWCMYFNDIGREKASVLVDHLLFFDMFNTIEAEAAYLGEEAFSYLGITQVRDAAHKIEPQQREKYLELASELGFPGRDRKKAKPPPFSFVADSVGLRQLYDFLYFATSKTVHFSTHELTRRPWGKYPNFKLKSPLFRDYWNAFSLVWGVRLLVFMMEANTEIMIDLPNLDMQEFEKAVKTIHEFKDIPIILPREVNWPSHLPTPALFGEKPNE